MTLLRKRIGALAADLQKSISRLERDVSAKDVHRLRTTIRRLESFISFAHPEVGRKQQKAIDELGSLRKRAGKVRDLDVQIGLLGAIANGSTGADRRAMTEILKAKRERQAVRLSSEVRDLRHTKLFPRLEKISEKAGLVVHGQHQRSPLDQARSEIIELARKTPPSQAMKARRLHELRISLKHIRYTAELAAESEAKQHMLEELKPVQDALGEWHDWETLVASAEKQFKGRVNCPLLMEMRALFSAKFSSATSAVGRLFAKHVPTEARKPSIAAASAPQLVRPA